MEIRIIIKRKNSKVPISKVIEIRNELASHARKLLRELSK